MPLSRNVIIETDVGSRLRSLANRVTFESGLQIVLYVYNDQIIYNNCLDHLAFLSAQTSPILQAKIDFDVVIEPSSKRGHKYRLLEAIARLVSLCMH